MVMIVHRSSMDHDVRALLSDLGVTAFTTVPDVQGVGAAGRALQSLNWPGSNSLVLAALEPERVPHVIAALRGFRDRVDTRRRDAPAPLHAFVLPCVQAA